MSERVREEDGGSESSVEREGEGSEERGSGRDVRGYKGLEA